MAAVLRPLVEGTPTSQTLTVPSQTNSPVLKSRLLGPNRQGSTIYPDSDSYEFQAFRDEGGGGRDKFSRIHESGASVAHLMIDFKAEVLWEDAARSKWHAQSVLYLVGNIKDAITDLSPLDDKKGIGRAGLPGLIMGNNIDLLAKSSTLQRVHNVILDVEPIILRCRGPLDLESVTEWKATQDKLRQLNDKLRSEVTPSTNVAVDNWDSVDMFDKSLFLSSLVDQSVAICKSRENTEVTRIISIDEVLALLDDLKDMRGLQPKQSQIMQLLHFCIDCAICVYMILEELQSNLTLALDRYNGGKRYIKTIMSFLKEISRALEKADETEDISYVLAYQSQLNEIASFIGNVDSLYTASWVGSSTANAYDIQACNDGIITVRCVPWNSGQRTTVAFNLDKYLGFEDGRFQWGGSKFSSDVQDITTSSNSLSALTRESHMPVHFEFKGLLTNFDGDLYAAPFNHLLTSKQRRFRLMAIPEDEKSKYEELEGEIKKLRNKINSRNFNCSNDLMSIVELLTGALQMLLDIKALIAMSAVLSKGQGLLIDDRSLEGVLMEVFDALKLIPRDVWMPLPISCREARQFPPINPTVWEIHLLQILDQLRILLRKLNLIYEQLRLGEYSLLTSDTFLKDLSKFGHIHLNGDNAREHFLRMPDSIPSTPSFLPSFLQVEIRSIKASVNGRSQRNGNYAIMCSFAGYQHRLQNGSSDKEGIAYFPVFAILSDKNRTMRMACVTSGKNPDQPLATCVSDFSELVKEDQTTLEFLPRDASMDVWVTISCVLLNASEMEIGGPSRLSDWDFRSFEFVSPSTAESQLTNVEVTLTLMTEPSTLKDCITTGIALMRGLAKWHETESLRPKSQRNRTGVRDYVSQKSKSVVRGVLRSTLRFFGESKLEDTYVRSRHEFAMNLLAHLIPLISWANQVGGKSFYHEEDLKTLLRNLKKVLSDALSGYAFDDASSQNRADESFSTFFEAVTVF